MAANKGMVAGSHKRNEFVMIQHDGDAPAAVRAPSLPPTAPSLLRVLFATASCRARVGGSGSRALVQVCDARGSPQLRPQLRVVSAAHGLRRSFRSH